MPKGLLQMIKHVVLWKFKPQNKDETITKVQDELTELAKIIPQVLHLETGKNIFSGEFDLVLLSEFQNEKDLNIYQNPPKHQQIKNFLSTVCEKRACIDYTI